MGGFYSVYVYINIGSHFQCITPLLLWSTHPSQPSIRGNIPNENKAFKQILQKSCSEKCQQSHVCGEVKVIYFYTKFVNHNIGHVSDTSFHVYHFDHHEVLFHHLIFLSLHFFKTLARLHQHRGLAFDYTVFIVETSFVASYSIDTLNVIYRSHTPILLVWLQQKYIRISLYIINHLECFKKIITTIIFIRNHQLRRRLLPSFMLMRRGFVRCNFIGYHGWNGQGSTNQLWQHISHVEHLYFLFHRLLVHNFSQLWPGLGHFKYFSHLSPARDCIFVFLVLPEALRTMNYTCDAKSNGKRFQILTQEQ